MAQRTDVDDLTLTRAGQRFRRERAAARAARAELAELVVAAVAAGWSINAVAELSGLTRLEVRRIVRDVNERVRSASVPTD